MGERAGVHASRSLGVADVVGQVEAKWACEVAAASRHHLLFHGPPGVGKTMHAERVPGLLPDLEVHDAPEVSAVHSLAGFNLADELITRPPYSDHTIRRRSPALLAAASGWSGREPFRVRTRACFFSMTPRNPNPPIRT
jgi:magnesium chelatase family protein